MKKFLNTLYVTTDGTWLRKEGENIVAKLEKKEIFRVPKHHISDIVCFGRISVSPHLMEHCASSDISISFLSMYGKFLSRVEGPQKGNVLLRRAQHKATLDNDSTLSVVKNMVSAKIANQRTLIRRAVRDHSKSMSQEALTKLNNTERQLTGAIRQTMDAENIEDIRGLEGSAANNYFGCFNHLIIKNQPKFEFKGRSKRPPLDAPNALLSFLYTIMAHDCRSACETVGLDPQMGFLHKDRPGRPSLALDFLEEFRSPISDRVCLNLMNRKQVQPSDFRFEPNGAVLLHEDSRKVVLEEFQNRKKTEMMHPYINEKIPLGLFPFVQAQLLARHLRGDLNGYPPFIWK